jgi:UDP-N-acetylglucosamine:LPS N-acetylglucosamine transferase
VLIGGDHYATKNRKKYTQGCILARFKLSLFLIFSCCTLYLVSNETDKVPPPRKTLLILSSTGGGGHLAACNTLEQLVGKEYDLKVVYPINELRIWGVPSCEEIYNKMLKKGWIRSMNFIVRHVVPTIFRTRQGKIEKIITSYIKAYHPDLVVSLIPFINYSASEAARKQDLPFLLITTDNDLRNWAFEMEKAQHTQMRITIGTDLPTTREILLKKHIPEHMIETIGLPLRPEFISHRGKEKSFDFLPNQKRILIMMGGAGGEVAYDYARKIGKIPLGVHIIVIAGRNKKLKEDLEGLSLHPSNALSVFGYTNEVAGLMAISDIIITKPGPGTINEAMAMKLPVLIDHTSTSLFWERANVDIVLKYGIGQRIKRFNDLEELLVSYLQTSEVKERIDRSFFEVPSNQFHLRIPQLIQEMLSTPYEEVR